MRPASYPDEGLGKTCTDVASSEPVPSAILPWTDFKEEVENWVDTMVNQSGDQSLYVQSLAAPVKVYDEYGVHYHLDVELLSPLVQLFNSGTPGLLPTTVRLKSHKGGEFRGHNGLLIHGLVDVVTSYEGNMHLMTNVCFVFS